MKLNRDQIVIAGAVGILVVIAYLYYMHMVGEKQHFEEISVEDKIGARVPFFARGGHYGAFGIIPSTWEKHRLMYPRRACSNTEALLNGVQSMNRPNFDADDCAWFSMPPSESIF